MMSSIKADQDLGLEQLDKAVRDFFLKHNVGPIDVGPHSFFTYFCNEIHAVICDAEPFITIRKEIKSFIMQLLFYMLHMEQETSTGKWPFLDEKILSRLANYMKNFIPLIIK